ncbi:MAG: hypothetical protein NC428_11900 [Clostridium sp.]|nr:hypothetical protein [Clostridium sp.]
MNQNTVYEPIRKKMQEWIWYDDNEPKGNYFANKKEHDEFRSLHDRDCVLTGGELKADTLFSLWLPLRHTIVRMNDAEKIKAVGNINRKCDFLRELIKGDNLEKLLPEKEEVVKKLSILFELGLCRENVFLLPDRQLNCARARKPYYDYVPVFLLESFPGGAFAHYWNSPEEHLQWIEKEHLEMFFDGEVSPDTIKDLSGSGNVRISLAPEGIDAMECMLDNYSNVLRERKKYFS